MASKLSPWWANTGLTVVANACGPARVSGIFRRIKGDTDKSASGKKAVFSLTTTIVGELRAAITWNHTGTEVVIH